MRLLLLEYITAGGLNRDTLKTSLLEEAILMRDALLRDFSDIPDIELTTTYDARLSNPGYVAYAIPIDVNVNPIEIWQKLLTNCDTALIVAPETSDILTKLTKMIEAAAIKNLGCHIEAVTVASDKYYSYQLLTHAGIATISTYKITDIAVSKLISSHGFIVKPNDGAGCEATHYFSNKSDVQAWLVGREWGNLIIQPYQPGLPASISAVFKNGQAWVLSCNEQLIKIQAEGNKSVMLKGCRVNALNQYLDGFNKLANKIAATLPTLNGFAGIDVILDKGNIYVVEINPRITTSYIGLRESLDYNPAQLILDSVLMPAFEMPVDMTKNTVDIHLNV
ncbi:MAG: ATP-grasp domain-containing protein [Methylotenera sp.]|nr:ATP-grasp domain-containing protein [Methylotenera sp.]